MNKYPLPANEAERLKKLDFLNLVNLGKDPQFDVFAETACLISHCPASLIAIMRSDEQTMQSCVGLSIDSVDRKNTLCQYSIASGEVVVINNTLLDDRSSNNPIILEGGIKFYTGVPIIDEDGFALGTICVIDYVPRTISENQIDALKKLSDVIAKILTSKRKTANAEYFQQTFDISNNIICVLDNKLRFKEVNPAFENIYSIKKEDAVGQYFADFLGQDDQFLSVLDDFKNGKDISFTTFTRNDNDTSTIVEWSLKQNEKFSEVFCFGINITSQLEEKRQLESSERRFRSFFENAIGLMSMHDMDGNIIAVNEKGREALQYSAGEVATLNLKDLVPESHLPSMMKYLERINKNKEDFGTMILKTKDGSELIWMYHNLVEMDQDGRPYVVSTALNITERMILEKDLLHTKKMLEQTSSVAQVGGWEVNLKTNTVFWSESTKEIHKIKSDYQPNLENAICFYKEDNQDRVTFLFNRAVKEGIPYDEEFQLVRNDGITIWVRVKAIPEFENGECVRVFGIIQDIDKFKNMLLEVSKKEAMMQSFATYAPDAIAMFDKNLNYLAVSSRWKEEFNMNYQDLIGQNIFTISPNVPEERKEIYQAALKGETYVNEDFVINTEDKGTQHYNLKVGPWYVSDDEIGGVIVSVQNITNAAIINKELKEAKRIADIASKAKSEFLANMSHEIRTPLNGVIGFSDLLLRTPLNDIQTQYLNYINQSGENLLNIINDILDFSKIESGKLELLIEPYDVYDMVSQVINVILYQSQKKNIELLLNIEPGLPKTLFLDGARLKQILINLLGNAVKFTKEGEIELKVEKLNIDNQNIKLRFSVRDTGIGIQQDKQKYIFDAFTQENSSISKRYGGTGLGLTISNNILRYMRSNLSLISAPEKGSVFFFDIEIPYEMSETKDEDELLSIKRVLIVDDNKANRIILKHMLAYKNVESVLAATGMEALQMLLKGEHFDVILMDYHMPIISGLETIDKIKELFSQRNEVSPLIILHTSSEDHDVINSFRKEDNSYFLMKPIKSEELYKALHRLEKNIFKDEPVVKITGIENVSAFQEMDVLLVDDNPVNMVLNNRMMKAISSHFNLTEAVNGLEALEQCRKKQFSIVLMDVQMPIMDGMEATKQIRLLPGYETVPIIGVTAGNVLGEKEKCLESGMNDFLPKPLRQNDLEAMLKKYFPVADESDESADSIALDKYIDMHMLNGQIGDDIEFQNLFLNLVVQQLDQAVKDIKIAQDAKNVLDMEVILHKLKGTAGSAGLFRLAEYALEWERKLRENMDFTLLYRELSEEIRIGIDIIKNLIK